MAKDQQAGSIFDMFSKFGQDLKMPSVDVDAIMAHHRKNLEAFEQSAKASVAGASSVVSRQREILEASLREMTDMARNFQAPGNPQEMMSKQADFARRSFELALKNAEEMAELVKRSSSDSVEILRKRIQDSMQEIRNSYDGKS